jgi:asparagine synthase (glutamine-hydrolysing)
MRKMLDVFKVESVSELLRLMNEKAWTKDTIHSVLAIKNAGIFEKTELSTRRFEVTWDDIIDRMMRNDYKMFLRDDILTKVDRASMAVSLECRDPMLDHRIAEFAFKLPMNYLFHKGEHKYILKAILRKYLSDDIVNLPKRGFMIPIYYWLNNNWKPIVMEYLSTASIKSVGMLNYKQVTDEVNRFYKYEGYRAEKIWMMLNFQMWAQKWYLK